jgi:hypothetical protein
VDWERPHGVCGTTSGVVKNLILESKEELVRCANYSRGRNAIGTVHIAV